MTNICQHIFVIHFRQINGIGIRRSKNVQTKSSTTGLAGLSGWTEWEGPVDWKGPMTGRDQLTERAQLTGRDHLNGGGPVDWDWTS